MIQKKLVPNAFTFILYLNKEIKPASMSHGLTHHCCGEESLELIVSCKVVAF